MICVHSAIGQLTVAQKKARVINFESTYKYKVTFFYI